MHGLLAQSQERYLRSPRLVDGEDGPVLHLLAWDTARQVEQHLRFGAPFDTSTVLAEGEALHDLTVSDAPVVDQDPHGEDRAQQGGEAVAVLRSGGVSRVVLLRSGEPIEVWAGAATASAPALAPAAGGTWIAFHHDLREDTGVRDLPKWIAVFFVDRAGQVFEPAAPMTDRDRDREGEEQGFEFPSLVVGEGGALALFGRGSHRFWRQDLSARGFGPRVPLGGGDWGCRGRRVAALRVPGGVLTARRERQGILIATLEEPAGGPPALIPRRQVPSAHEPRKIRPAAPDPATRWDRRTLFGDIHQHSAHSDGCGTAHEPYLRARFVYGDDFGALSDHESFLGKRIGPGEWSYLQAVAVAHDAPGQFSTLFAYEWTGRAHPGPGHKVVYSERPGTPVVSRDAEPTGQGLLAKLRSHGAIAVPHHVGWTGADEAAHDPDLQPVWEICSCHGCYIHAQHPLGGRGELRDQMVEAVLRRGRRFGFIACSDGHGLLYHHGVGRKRDSFRTGLTAVQAASNDRSAIFAALRERRCYATSGVPIYLDLDAEGQPMGSVLAGPRRVRVRAAGVGPLRSLSLVGEHGTLATAAGRGAEAELEARLERGWAYAKVEQADGEMAWSSPLWVEGPC
jgi:hypothetical protein